MNAARIVLSPFEDYTRECIGRPTRRRNRSPGCCSVRDVGCIKQGLASEHLRCRLIDSTDRTARAMMGRLFPRSAKTAVLSWRHEQGGSPDAASAASRHQRAGRLGVAADRPWRPLTGTGQALSEPTGVVGVDPTNHDILYSSSADGLVKSLDGGQSWSVILPTAEYAHTIAVSPANHDVVYVGLGKRGDPGRFRYLRSKDGGASWEQTELHLYSLCGWSVPILLPHPTDENRLFRSADCRSGANFYDHLRQSLDQGASWTTLFGVGRAGISNRDSSHPQYAYPTDMVGGQGAEPGRFYLVTHRDSRVGRGTSLFRSDDDAQTWTEIFRSRPATEPDGAIIQLGGLTYDLARPDTVYLGRNVYAPSTDASRPLTFVSAGVLMSADGGSTWTALGRQDLPEIYDLALGVDRRNLYVADKEDLRRFRLE